MTDLFKSIEIFLEKNGLIDTFKAFKSEAKRSSNLTPKSAYSSLNNIHKTIIPNDTESQNKLRQHLQKADPKYLKRFVDRMKKSRNKEQQTEGKQISQLPFFKKLVEKEMKLYEEYKENVLHAMNSPPYLMDQSRMHVDEWEGENDIGYEVIEFSANETHKIMREVQDLKHYQTNAIKTVAFPEAYYTIWQRKSTTATFNQYDKLISKLPSNVIFQSSKNKNDGYPIQCEGKVYASYDLKIIYDREKTGFEEQRQMPIVINEVLAGRFQILSLLGQAQFSKAIEVKDLTSSNQKQKYCLKMILNNKEYLDQALDQIKLLRYIKNNCNPDEACLIHMHDFFYHREHLMILTQLLKQNLYDTYTQNPTYFTLPRLQVITKQILTALATLHTLHIIHNDLKPENILIKSYSNSLVKVIDVGSSVFFHDQLQFYVQTRSYRAPEIILGCPYTQKIDIWSLGCIVAELFTRQVLFQSNNTIGILAKVQGLRGPWPSWMLQKGKQVDKYFTKDLILFEEIVEQIGEQGNKKKRKTGFNRVYMPKMTNLRSRVKSNNKNFQDFLSKCLKIDPSVRMSAKEALNHPFITQPIEL